MSEQFLRTELLLGTDGMLRLADSRVAVFGLGGVGGHAAEALVRSGIGHIDLIDRDTFSISNLNRQLFATVSSVGKYKTEAAAARLKDINPSCEIRTYNLFFTPETAEQIPFEKYDYILDAIDTVTGKLELVRIAKLHNIPIICSMGAGNKLDPTKFEVADIYDTSVCPLARIMRKECRKRGIDHLKVVYSKEVPLVPLENIEPDPGRHSVPGSTAFVPSVCGLIMAAEVVKDLSGFISTDNQ